MADKRKPVVKPGLAVPDPEPPRRANVNDFGPPGQSPSAENLEGGKKSGLLNVDGMRAKGVKTLKSQ